MCAQKLKIVGSQDDEFGEQSWTDVHRLLAEEIVLPDVQAVPSGPPVMRLVDLGEKKLEAPSYYVRNGSGRVIGPMPQDLVSTIILSGKLAGDEDVRSGEDEPWQPLAMIPELAAALKVRRPLQQTDTQIAEPELTARLDNWGVIPLFLNIARNHMTGWLKVEHNNTSKVVSFLFGLPINVRSNSPKEFFCSLLVAEGRISEEHVQKALELSRRLKIPVGNALVSIGAMASSIIPEVLGQQAKIRIEDLMTWTSGEARFDADPVAGRDDNHLGTPALDLCLQRLQNWSPQQMLEELGPAATELRPGQEVLEDSPELVREMFSLLQEQPVTTAALVTQLSQQGHDETEVRRMLCLLLAMDSVRLPQSSKEEIEALRKKVFLGNPLDVLELDDKARMEQIQLKLEALDQEVSATCSGLSAQDPRRLSLEDRLDEVRSQLQDPVERYIMARAHFMRVDYTDASVKNALEAEYLERLVRAGVAAERYAEIALLAARLAEKSPQNPTAISYHGLVRVMTAAEPDLQKATLKELVQKCTEFPHSMELHLAVVAAGLHTEQFNEARHAFKSAHNISPDDPRLQSLRQRLLDRPAISAAVGVDDKASTLSPLFFKVIGASLMLFFVLWLTSVVIGLGEKEYFYDGTDWFWYARRFLLIGFALGAVYFLRRRNPLQFFQKLGFGVAVKPLAVALVIGAVSGFLSPAQRVTGVPWVVLTLTLIHVLAEQIFFTGFLTKGLLEALPKKAAAVAVSAVLFGIYHVTYYSFMVETSSLWIPYWLGVIAVGGGLPYALLYSWSRSIVPPLLCHLAVNMMMMYKSLFF